jgi:para-nitrobenzyl esterase
VNFAKSGDPNGHGLPPWPVFTEPQQAAMYFGDTSVGAKILPNVEKLKALDNYYARCRMEARGSAPNTR